MISAFRKSIADVAELMTSAGCGAAGARRSFASMRASSSIISNGLVT